MPKKYGKKYREVAKLVEPGKLYNPTDAIDLVRRVSYTNFNGTVELHLRMGVDPRQADQQVRGVALLPNGLGKSVRVLVFAEGEPARIAREAGAEHVGSDDLIKQIQDGWLDFDVAFAPPDMMGKLGKSGLGRILGRRGLMPNPRAGTVVQPDDLPRAINDARKGRVEFRLDRTALIHVPVGKVEFEPALLEQNLLAMIEAIVRAKPSGAKANYIRALTICPSMGPSVRLDMNAAFAAAGVAP